MTFESPPSVESAGAEPSSSRASLRIPQRRTWWLLLIPGALAIGAAACSSDTKSASSTSAAATTSSGPSSSLSETTAAATSNVFSSEVMPILQNNCASCHSADGPGAAHLVLATAGDASKSAKYIAASAGSRYMPPWPAGDGEVKFHDDRRLSTTDLDSLKKWVAVNGEIDVPADTPLTPTRQAIVPIERDVVMKALPYKGSTAKPDDYRCQIFDPKLTKSAFLQGYGIEPDRTEVVHHSLVYRASAAKRAEYEKTDADAPGPGWQCLTVTSPTGASDGVNQIMSWAPGQAPVILPADTGIAMEPGDFLIVQIHYHYEEKTDELAPDQSAVVLDFASDKVIAAAGGALEPVTLKVYFGPAELPCSTKETGPLCDRETAKIGLLERSGPFAALGADGLMALCGKKLEDYASMTTGIVTSTCELPAQDGQIVSIWAHMHYLGSTFRMTLNPGTPQERVLLDIPKWDFNWQLDYRPSDTVIIKATDVIKIECVWDRAKIPKDAEPRYIISAEGTADEMCYSQIVTRPVAKDAVQGTQP
jgi:mono/diheme cytochrome c family protein